MLELAIWMYHIGNPDPVVRVITDVATSLVILWGVVNHYAKKESDKEFMDVYNEMRNWKAVAHYNAEQAQELRERLNEKWEGFEKVILEKLHRGINSFNKTFNWRRFRRDALHLGESLLVFGILYGIFSTLIWGVCWIFKINYDPDLVAVAWAVPVLLDTMVNKAYDWNNEVRDWD